MNRLERLSPSRAALLVIDVQERLLPAMPADVVQQVVRNIKILIEAAARLGLPIVVSQQYPKGLGATVSDIEVVLAQAKETGAAVHRFDKVEFSAACTPPFAELRLGRDQWIVTGMETHVCVYQSVRDLVAANNAVHVCADAVCSRTRQNWGAGLDLMNRLGAINTTTEVCVFDLLERAGTENFKALSKAIK